MRGISTSVENHLLEAMSLDRIFKSVVRCTAPVLASQAEAIVDLGRTWPQHRIDIH